MAERTIAVGAKHLESIRKVVPDKPKEHSAAFADLPAMAVAATANVINTEEFKMDFATTTTGRGIAAIMAKYGEAISSTPAGSFCFDSFGISPVGGGNLRPHLLPVGAAVLPRRKGETRPAPYGETTSPPTVATKVRGRLVRAASSAKQGERGCSRLCSVCRSPQL